jgi:hypothetical protein
MSSDDDQLPYAPIFRPTAAEFSDFKQFVYSLSRQKSVQLAGCAKVD